VPATSISANVVLDPTDITVPLSMTPASSGADWAVDSSGSDPNAGVWDLSSWGNETSKPATIGLPLTATGQRYSLRVSFAASAAATYYGHELDFSLLPERRLDR